MLDETQLGELLDGAQRSLFRWEGLRRYTVGSDGADFERYLDGAPGPTMSRKRAWLDVLAADTARGVSNQRVRLIRPPLSDYERYACEWGYAYNVPAGDDTRIWDASELQPPRLAVDHDFWLLDERVAIPMHYDPDGKFIGAEIAHESVTFAYRQARAALWQNAEPFFSWWDRHPEHHRRATRAA